MICGHKMNRNHIAKAQFKELHVEEVDKNGRETVKIIREQNSIEWEVRKYYYDLYSEKNARIKNCILPGLKIGSKSVMTLSTKTTTTTTTGTDSIRASRQTGDTL